MRITLAALAIFYLLGACTSTPPVDIAVHGDGTAEFRGATMRYSDLGTADDPSAPPIVCVHGWSSGREVWYRQVDAMRDEYRILTIDLPGYGESDDVADEHSMDLYADAIAAVLDDAGVEQAILVGHSNGTPTVRQFSRRYPKRTAGLVAVDGSLLRVFPKAQVEQFLAVFEGDDFRTVSEQFFAPLGAVMAYEQDADMALERLRRTPQRVMVGGLQAVNDDSIWLDDSVAVPMLVINASNPMWNDEYVNSVKSMGSDVEYNLLRGSSHYVMLDKYEEFNDLLTDWLTRHGW